MSVSCTLIFFAMWIEFVELQGETLAFHFICCIFRLIGWGGRVFGSRRTYRHRSICVDWHCWCHTVCLCVSQVFATSLSRAYAIVCSLHCCAFLPASAYNVGGVLCSGLIYWTCHSEDWLDKRILKADITWAHWWEFNINCNVVALPRPPSLPGSPKFFLPL